ncbi:MAG: tetratricopeptide repeat protein [Phycisphaerales bacterium JB040]
MSDPRILRQLQQAHEKFAKGRVDEAIAGARRAIAKAPGHPEGARLICQMLLTRGRVDEARYALEGALRTHPERADLHLQAGEVEAMAGGHAPALGHVERALELSPGLPRALAVRGRLLLGAGRHTEAVADLRAASEELPDEPEHRSNLSMALLATGHAPEACDLLRELCRERPAFLPARAALAQSLNYHPDASPEEIAEAHRAYGRLAESQVNELAPDPGALKGDGPVRVGFLTRDLRRHSCAYFLLPILEHLDRARFEPVAYMDDPHADDLTEVFRGRFALWRETARLSNRDLADTIRKDRVGLLLDLGAHFFGNRLAVMAHRPAPASATYLAYPNTTGLSRVDARIVDGLTDPEGGERGADPFATETLVRLEAPLWCYRPDTGLPEPGACPDGQAFTYASFNDLKKINGPLLDDWAEILTRAPGTRLLLKTGALGDDAVRAELRERLASRGVDPDRFELLGHVADHAEHLALYRRAHVALDTHPYCGTTTTLEAAWMGVPTVTLAPDVPRHASRVGLSLNTALGLTDCITGSRAEYVNRAVELAESFQADPSRLNTLRVGLRERFEGSPLRDEAGFTRRFEAALERVIELARGRA